MKTKKPKDTEAAVVAQERADQYFLAHPDRPSALRHPRLTIRSGVWIALLGNNISEGIAGFGFTVEAALRNFDVQYLNSRPPRIAG
jgi:hypothetical protein